VQSGGGGKVLELEGPHQVDRRSPAREGIGLEKKDSRKGGEGCCVAAK